MATSADPEGLEFKEITQDGIPAAVEMAEHYRLLSQPALAKSICLDVLAVDPDHQRGLVTLILAITDQFGQGGADNSPQAAREHLDRLEDDYQRSYYAGIISEREARGFLERGPSQGFAYNGFRQAMDWYEQAAATRPAGNDLAILRWNSCARAIKDRRLKPRVEEHELGLE